MPIFIWGEHRVVNSREVVFPWCKTRGENNHPRVDNFRCSSHMKAIIVYLHVTHIIGQISIFTLEMISTIFHFDFITRYEPILFLHQLSMLKMYEFKSKVAIFVVRQGHQTQCWKRTIQGVLHLSLICTTSSWENLKWWWPKQIYTGLK